MPNHANSSQSETPQDGPDRPAATASSSRALPEHAEEIPQAETADQAGEWGRADKVLVIVLVAASALVLLPNLGDRCLWQDEAECALLAQNVLRYGLPRAWDGRNLVTAQYGTELTDGFLWAWTPWAMHYIAAAGMAVLGQTPLGARLPFALLGCASVGLTYTLARRLVRDRWAASLAAVLLITSVQYLLLMRQCRYYGIVPVAALVAMLGFVDLHRRRGWIALLIGMVVLFHANYLTCACVAIGLGAYAALWRRTARTWIALTTAGLAGAALTLPWFFGLGVYRVFTLSQGLAFAGTSVTHELIKLVFVLNQFVCPLVVVVALSILAATGKLRVRGAYRLVACMAVPVLILVPAFLWAGPRYLVHMLPLGSIVVAAAVREVYLRDDVLGNIGAVMVGATNLLPAVACAILPASFGLKHLDGDYATGPAVLRQAMLKSEWAGYVNELRQPYVGPNEAITDHLKAHADPDAVVHAPYGMLPIMFHTDLRCAGVLKEASRRRPGWEDLPNYVYNSAQADWLVIRPAWVPKEGYGPLEQAVRARARRTGRRLVAENLQVRDTGWGNRPLLRYHYFQSPGSSPDKNVIVLGPKRSQELR